MITLSTPRTPCLHPGLVPGRPEPQHKALQTLLLIVTHQTLYLFKERKGKPFSIISIICFLMLFFFLQSVCAIHIDFI